MKRTAKTQRQTKETQISVSLDLDGSGKHQVTTGIGFFDHMLTLFSVHSLMDLNIDAQGDIEVDYHHTVEDVGLVLGDAIQAALGDRKGIRRYGNAWIPMDDALAHVVVDLSNRPFMVMKLPEQVPLHNGLDATLAKEFFRSLAQRAGMNLHITITYGENWHHMIEAVFKGFGRALRQAVEIDPRVSGVPSSKGSL